MTITLTLPMIIGIAVGGFFFVTVFRTMNGKSLGLLKFFVISCITIGSGFLAHCLTEVTLDHLKEKQLVRAQVREKEEKLAKIEGKKRKEEGEKRKEEDQREREYRKTLKAATQQMIDSIPPDWQGYRAALKSHKMRIAAKLKLFEQTSGETCNLPKLSINQQSHLVDKDLDCADGFDICDVFRNKLALMLVPCIDVNKTDALTAFEFKEKPPKWCSCGLHRRRTGR